MNYDEDQISAWAETQPHVRAILVIGSRARRDHPADDWSDLDLIVFVDDFNPYLAQPDWLDVFGEVWVWIRDWIGTSWSAAKYPEYLAVYAGGNKLDFSFFPVDRLRQMAGDDPRRLDSSYQRGYRVLVDKDGLAAQLPPPLSAPLPAAQPSAQEFQTLNEEFWYAALQVARCLRRGDLWGVKVRDHTLKKHLLAMIECHAHARHGWDRDTWHDGRFMREWGDPQAWQALHQAFAHFDAADSARALRVTLDLFRRLSAEAAQPLGYAYPAQLDARITGLIEKLDAGPAER